MSKEMQTNKGNLSTAAAGINIVYNCMAQLKKDVLLAS